MILNRIGTAIKRQDWFVVFVELMIVVVGIYIGLQVDDWQKARQDRAVGDRYLERLLADTDFNILVMADLVDEHSEVADTLFAFIQEAEAGTDNFPTGEPASFTFCRFFINRQPGLSMATIEELISTGNLALIQNENLREALPLIHAHTVRDSRDDLHLSNWMSETARSFSPYIHWHSDEMRTRSGLEIDIQVGCSADMKAMAKNEAIVSEVTKVYRAEFILASIYTEQMNSWKELKTMIEGIISGEAE